MIYVATHVGKHHTVSEDTVLVGSHVLFETTATWPEPQNGFVCVADGVGGCRGGEKASRYVLRALANYQPGKEMDLRAFLTDINRRMIEEARSEGTTPDMATTMTGIYLEDGVCTLCHIGNTRAYIRQGKYLKQITPDHTVYAWLMNSGQVEAAERCNKNEITNCFGGSNPALLSKLYITECPPFSLALLTSDGVHEYVDLDTLETILLGEGSYEKKCEDILRKARENGSEDDLSVVIYQREDL